MHSVKTLGIAVLSLMVLSLGQDQDEAAIKKQKTIRELLQQTGSAKLASQVITQMGERLSKSMPAEFGGFWKEFISEVKTDELMDLVVPIYDKFFTQEELEGIIQFNRTPLGQKIITTMPDVMKESMAAGAEWGRGVATKALERFQEKKKGDK